MGLSAHSRASSPAWPGGTAGRISRSGNIGGIPPQALGPTSFRMVSHMAEVTGTQQHDHIADHGTHGNAGQTENV